MIELVLAFQDKDGQYAEHAGVVLASVFHNTSSPVNVHILHDETLNEDNKQKLLELTTGYGRTIHFYHITIPEDMLQVMAGVGSINIWTQACMYRLLLPALIPVDKIIYLDCDVLVNMDLLELWQLDLGDYYLGAIRDQGIVEVAHIINSKGLNPDLYFNSGVILFALNNIRKKDDWYEETLNFFRNFPDTTMPDQDALNAVFGGNYLPLDLRFNLFNITAVDHDFNDKIVHFTGEDKCWDSQSVGAELYRNYLGLTPWGEHEPQKTVVVHPTEVYPPKVRPTEVRPTDARKKIRKRKPMRAQRHRNPKHNITSYYYLKRSARKVPLRKPQVKKIIRNDRREKIILISLSSLKLIRTAGSQNINQNTETNSTPYLLLRKFN